MQVHNYSSQWILTCCFADFPSPWDLIGGVVTCVIRFTIVRMSCAASASLSCQCTSMPSGKTRSRRLEMYSDAVDDWRLGHRESLFYALHSTLVVDVAGHHRSDEPPVCSRVLITSSSGHIPTQTRSRVASVCIYEIVFTVMISAVQWYLVEAATPRFPWGL